MTERELCYQKGWSWKQLADFFDTDVFTEKYLYYQFIQDEIAKV
jgi:hypothetical protein